MSFLGHRYIKKYLRNRVPTGSSWYIRTVIISNYDKETKSLLNIFLRVASHKSFLQNRESTQMEIAVIPPIQKYLFCWVIL